jgi:hypothetical protein
MAAQTLSALNDAAEFNIYHDTDYASLSISGTFIGTITLQRRMGSEWRDVDTFTAPVEESIRHSDVTKYRLVMSAFTSGSAIVYMK